MRHSTYKIVAIAILIGLFVWGLDATIDYFFFQRTSFWASLITEVPAPEVFLRMLIMFCFVGFGIFVSGPLAKRKKAEEALIQSETSLRAIFNNSLQAFMLFDKNFIVRIFNNKANKWAGRVFGRTMHVGESIKDYIPEPDRGDFDKNFNRALRGEKVRVERHIVATNQTGYWFEFYYSPVYGDGDQIESVFFSVLDITDRKNAEEALRKSELQFRTLVDNLPIGLAVNQRDDGTCHYMNKHFEECYGWSAEILRDYEAFFNHVYPDLVRRQQIRERIMADIASGDPNKMHWEDVPITRSTGKQHYVSARNIPMPDQKLMMSLVWDVTDRKLAEEALQRRIHEMTTLYSLGQQINASLSLDQVVQVSLSGIMTSVNPDLVLLYRLEDSQLLLQGYKSDNAKFSHKEARVLQIGECLCGLAASGEKPIYSEDIHTDPRCSREECKKAGFRSFAALPLRSGDKFLGVLGLASIAEREFKEQSAFLETIANEAAIGMQNSLLYERVQNYAREMEERVAERTAELESANKELKDFAYVVSHDLKAPLRAVNQLAGWLASDYAHAFDQEGKEMVELLTGRVKRMYDLIDGILQYSRVGQIREKQEQIPLNNLVKEIIETIAPPPHFKIVFENELPTIVGDSVRIGQVFQNLLTNAIKFMDKPQGIVGIGCKDNGAEWQFSIADNGPGIEKKYHDKIFQIFQTLAPRDEQGRTGIGLTIVKKIIELYGGKIWVESKVGEGSTFYFILPKR